MPTRQTMDGTFPYKCCRCGVICQSVDELADPEHHNWPK